MKEKERARKIKMIIMDVDGTLTDGSLLLLPDGQELKSYNVKDGTGVLLARLAGLKTAIITGKISGSLKKRAEKLKIMEVYQGILDKKQVLLEILEKNKLLPEQIAYIGDDSHFICSNPGGKGAVREFIEFILEAQNIWPTVEDSLKDFVKLKEKI
jgi:3-deoxy-D-manno-octulosonate 8-phosphate phosphatase (KDO 8-P phosphatase)